MASGDRSLGLCSTCVSSSQCTPGKGPESAVMFCEEFDDSLTQKAKKDHAPFKSDKKIVLDTAMGLCCNCGNQEDCTLRHSPGGVWHCEQYC